ncbi:MAG: tellurite resistance/C4-dicarboxylate transporter family protein [Bacteroidetes bacterium]|nr:tellurite resistance/C4-dicarboxylate transporter family protein [Bacteroidota bacterium]MBK7108613.1 tellurite resistance/C4-dicarboxylate transporter family protein [Bacteroidota bacterium]MBK8489062.1 tellurite resistance/C4-dicarboxylate transporter family protein [Bacteroidota bacterium]MBK8680911.1 tellurite resistance/C4-dicarboxylate transporter family protein [Bacteroidota bacterium]
MLEEFKNGVKNLSPAYFAIVMATGIISTGSFLMDMNRIANFLFVLNNIFYIIMWALTILRLVWYSKSLIKDLTDHMSGTGFFTIVAGTCVLGIQYIIMFEFFEIALALLILGIFLWLFLTYAVFTTLTIKQDKPTLDKGITGGWLTAIVATQSVSILSALIASHIKQPYRIEVNFFALSMWLWGGMFYIWMISLIFYRYTFFKFSPGDLAPPYWINMGAMAISTLAGSLLIINAPDAPLLESLLPFLKGFTVFYWATGTWWIPMLIILAIWRHIYKRYPLKYDSLYWGAVFPQGMYAVCTFRMSEALEIPFLHYFYNAFIYIALIAWALTFSGLIRHFLAEFAKVKLKINAMKNQV